MTELHAGDPIPATLTARDMQRVFNQSASSFYRLQKRGAFRRFRLAQPIGHAKYSGLLVQQYLARQPLASFGIGSRRQRSEAPRP